MKRLFLPLLLAVATAFTACDNGSEQTFETLGFYPTDNGLLVYADQVSDTSYRTVATQSWAVSSDAAWLSVTPTEGRVPQGKIDQSLLTLVFAPNTTGDSRTAMLMLKSPTGVVSKSVEQVALLHLTKPRLVRDNITGSPLYSLYVGEDTTKNSSSVALRLYTTTAKVRSEVAWLKVDTSAIYAVGDTVVPVTLERNHGEARHGYITLYTPEGITTKVRFQQASQK